MSLIAGTPYHGGVNIASIDGSEKTSSVNNDELVMKDSEADGELKLVKKSNLVDGKNKGYYATEAALNAAHPTATNGDYAIVGSTDTVWIWDSDTSAWVDSGLNGAVISIFGRTGTVTAQSNDYTWAQINKATSSIADITTKNHTDLAAGNGSDHADVATNTTHRGLTVTHGATGAVVGTTNIQTLTNKILTNEGRTTQILTDGASIACDFNNGGLAKVIIEGNRTLAAPTNIKVGGIYFYYIFQDDVGGRTLAYNAVFKFPHDTAPIINVTANTFSVLMCISFDGTTLESVPTYGFN